MTSPALAGEPTEKNKEALRAYLIVECLDGLNDEVRVLLAYLRKNGKIPPYSDAWCVKEGFMPWSLRKDDKES